MTTSNKANVPTEEVFGVAKKISKELEALPAHTHAAVISLIGIAFQHRTENEKAAAAEAERLQREEAIKRQREWQERNQPNPTKTDTPKA